MKGSNYAQILRLTGALRFSLAGIFARAPMSIAGIGAILLLAQERDSYAVAGTASACYLLAAALIGPQVFRLIDAFGQRRVVPVLLAIHVPVFAAMVLVAVTTDLNWPIYLLALGAGASQPDAQTLVRARWAALLPRNPLLRTAFAWESVIDDIVLVVGPPLGALLAVRVSPVATLGLSMVLLVAGTLVMVADRSTEPPPSGRRVVTKGRPAVLLPGVAQMCGVFGSVEVSTVALTASAGEPELSGTVLALFAVGSLLAGVVFGAARMTALPLAQFVAATVVFGAVFAGTALVAVLATQQGIIGVVALVGIALFLAGIARAPTLISGTSVIQGIVPPARLSETLAWSMSALSVGVAIATPLAGWVVDNDGAAAAYWVPAGCAVAATALALMSRVALRSASLKIQQPAPDPI